MPVVTLTPLTMSYFVRDITTAVVTFDRMRWFRSRTGRDGLYEAATAASPQPAVLSGSAESPHQAAGKTLSFKVDGSTEVSVALTGTDPLTTADIVALINAATSAVVASEGADTELVLTTASTGSAASIEILDGDAAPFLGLSVGAAAVGLDQDNALVAGTHEYFYTDSNADYEFFYRTQLLNSTTGQESVLSAPLSGFHAQGVPVSESIVCFVKLASMTGAPVRGRKITLFNVGMPNTLAVSGETGLWGVSRQYVQTTTDIDGYAEIRLLRGITVDLNIEGGVTRRITIPTSGDIVDLLDPALSASDEFGIQEPNIPFAIRTN